MANLNWVDYIILAIFLFSMLAGFGRGFVREVISLLTIIAAFIVASMFANTLAVMFTSSASVQTVVAQASASTGTNAAQSASYVALGLSYTLLFVGTLIIGSIIGFFVNMAFQAGILGIGNRLLGAVFGLARGFIINLVIIFVVQLTPFASQPAWGQSQMVVAFQPAVQWLGNLVSPTLANLKEKLGNTLQDMNSSIQNVTNSIQGVVK